MPNAPVVNQYKDPYGATKKIERIQVQQDDVNDRITLRDQYKQQVFQPSHNLPTMSLDELADKEVKEAMEREERQKLAEQQRANEDSEDEEVLERQRKHDLEMDDFKDYNPKGKGVTKRI